MAISYRAPARLPVSTVGPCAPAPVGCTAMPARIKRGSSRRRVIGWSPWLFAGIKYRPNTSHLQSVRPRTGFIIDRCRLTMHVLVLLSREPDRSLALAPSLASHPSRSLDVGPVLRIALVQAEQSRVDGFRTALAWPVGCKRNREALAVSARQ